MYAEILLNRDMNNIVFEGRNMAYGAYDLRKMYKDRMTIAMLSSILVFITLFISFAFIQKFDRTADIPKMTVVTLEEPPLFAPILVITKPKSAPQAVQAGPKRPQVKFVPPVVVNDNIQEPENIPTQEEFKLNTIGSENIEGPENPLPIEPFVTEASGTGTIPVANPVIIDAPLEIYAVDQMPEFPGGEEAMYKFIRKNLDIPEMAKEMKENMNAIVQFIIDKNGNVRDVKILRSSSTMINKSAINVVNEMPKWKPGKFRGQSVEVIFKLPIKIQIQ